jgi:hypothetical protein
VVTGLVPASPTGFRCSPRPLSVATGAAHASVTGLHCGFRLLSLWLAVRVSAYFAGSRLGPPVPFSAASGSIPVLRPVSGVVPVLSLPFPVRFPRSHGPPARPVSLCTATSSGVVVPPPLLSRRLAAGFAFLAGHRFSSGSLSVVVGSVRVPLPIAGAIPVPVLSRPVPVRFPFPSSLPPSLPSFPPSLSFSFPSSSLLPFFLSLHTTHSPCCCILHQQVNGHACQRAFQPSFPAS